MTRAKYRDLHKNSWEERRPKDGPAGLRLAEIQGIIITAYSHLVYSTYLFATIHDKTGAKEWLSAIAPNVTHSNWDKDENQKPIKPKSAVNIAFTAPGLTALDLPPEALASFPQEFREGISEASRSRRLGDTGGSDPSRWEFGSASTKPIHLLLILQAPTKEELLGLNEKYANSMSAAGIKLIYQQDAERPAGKSEHFGFQDGISQPTIAGSPNCKPSDDPIATGEFILGYPNSYGILPPTPIVSSKLDPDRRLSTNPDGSPASPSSQQRDLGANGTFLVFRKLEQDVATFRRFFRDVSQDSADCERLMAKSVGRWKNGTPLALSPDNDDPAFSTAPKNNAFGYVKDDSGGLRCPIGAHIRRSNPRDTVGDDPVLSLVSVNRHRLLRRGVFYGPDLPEGVVEDDGKSRGILFLCINAEIDRQFEFVQQSWINNPKFGALYDDPDPLVGDNCDPIGDPDKIANMTVPQKPLRRRIKQVPRFVTVKGGAYLFLPSISALAFLACLTHDPTQPRELQTS